MNRTALADRETRFAVSTTFVIGACAVGLLVLLSALLSTWTDEEYTLASTAHGIAAAYARAIGFEKQGPLYFVVLAAWRALDASVFVARLFSVACIAGFLAVIASLLRRVWPDAPPLAFAAIAFNPFVVFAGVEIRLYASALLVSALLVVFFIDGFFEERDARAARIGFVLAAIAAAYLQYYVMFALVGCGAALLVYRRRALPVYLGACAIVALAMVPLIGIVRAEIGVDAPSHLSALAAVRIPLAAAADYLIPLHWARSGIARVAYGLLALIALGSLVAARPRVNAYAGAFTIVSGTTIVLFTLVGLIAHVFVIAPRQTAVLFVPLVLAVCALAATARRPQMTLGIGAISLLSAVLSLYALYGHGAKTGDWARVGAQLTHDVRAGDVVAVFDADVAVPLARYYAGPLVRVPRTPRADAYNSGSYVIHSDAEVEAVIGRARIGQRRLWLVRNNACTFRNPDYGCEHLDRIVARDYRRVAERTFFESSIVELEPR